MNFVKANEATRKMPNISIRATLLVKWKTTSCNSKCAA